MEKRQMKQFGKDVSLLGFGCMRLPLLDVEKQEVDFAAAEAMIDKALAAGVNYFDTAFMYHKGNSEKFLGKALAKHPRESFFLADKLPIWNVKTPEDVDSLFAKQLDRCNVSFFDFYLVHSLTQNYYKTFQQHNVYDKLLKLKEEGKISHLGFSFHDNVETLEKIVTDYKWDFVQIQLNYIDWDACDAKGLYAILEKHNLPAVIMEPVRGGALATLTDKALGILQKAAPEASAAS
ncbi:aldo/keto reductase, partial [Desulfovibrio sp. OttesenSCG-928-O18]|nr:aldo/keto reductase [Desulfovibrio sp. OttesenSCG-928-O18]